MKTRDFFTQRSILELFDKLPSGNGRHLRNFAQQIMQEAYDRQPSFRYTILMYIDLPYRLALIVIAALQFAISHRLVKRSKADSAVAGPRMEGPILAWGAGLSLIAYALGVLLWLSNPAWMEWSAMPLPVGLRWCGAPIMALGAAMHLWGTLHLGRNFTVTIGTVQCPTLVTSGPFRWVRHPLYSGGMLESLGVLFLVANGAVSLTAVAFWIVVALRTAKEEAALIDTFGDGYRDYQCRVGRFLPRWKGGRDLR